jgi:hypothetical protein
MTKLGLVGNVSFVQALSAQYDVVRFEADDRSAIGGAAVDVWLMSVAEVPSEVLAAVDRHIAPVLLLAQEDELLDRCSEIQAGVLDVARLPSSAAEVSARLSCLQKATVSWNKMASRLCTTSVHDLRSPLQGMRFTLAALAREGVLRGEYAEDLEMLEAVADTLEVQLHGMYNMGRRLSEGGNDLVELGAAVRDHVPRPFFSGRLQVASAVPLWVRGHIADLKNAVLDTLRVMMWLAPGSKPIVATGTRDSTTTRMVITGPVFGSVVAYLDALQVRGSAPMLRGTVRLPFAGLSYATDAVAASGGSLTLAMTDDEQLQVTMSFPTPDRGEPKLFR